jgi:hypothetical protein
MRSLLRYPRLRALLAYAIIAHLLIIGAAAASPALHEWMHPDADGPDHDCAITLFVAGACHDAPPPVLALAPDLMPLLDEVAREPLIRTSSLRFGGILEHAPPSDR